MADWRSDMHREMEQLKQVFDGLGEAISTRLTGLQTDMGREFEEQKRLSLEQVKFNERQARFNEEQAKLNEEQARFHEEQVKLNEEQARLNEEQARLNAEQARFHEEQVKLNEEQARRHEEQMRRNQEQAHSNQELHRSVSRMSASFDQAITEMNTDLLRRIRSSSVIWGALTERTAEIQLDVERNTSETADLRQRVEALEKRLAG